MDRGSIMKKSTAFLFAMMCIFVLAGCNTQSNPSEQEKKDGTEDVNGGEQEFGWNVNPDCKPVYRALYEADGRKWIDTITFKEDGTFEYKSQGIGRMNYSEVDEYGHYGHYRDTETSSYGKYTGDATKNGEVCLTVEKITDDNGNLIDYDGNDALLTVRINDGEFILFEKEYVEEFDRNHFYRVGYWKYSNDVVYEGSIDKNSIFKFVFKEDGTFVASEKSIIDNKLDYEAVGYYTGNATATGFYKIKLLLTQEKEENVDFITERSSIKVLRGENEKLDSDGQEFVRKS